MDVLVSDIMQKNVVVANVDDSVEKIESLLVSNHISFIPTLDSDGRCFGVISEQDIVKFHLQKGDAKFERAWEICSHNIIDVYAGTSVAEASQLIIDKKIHHIVVTENEAIVGILSSVDIIQFFLNKYQLNSESACEAQFT